MVGASNDHPQYLPHAKRRSTKANQGDGESRQTVELAVACNRYVIDESINEADDHSVNNHVNNEMVVVKRCVIVKEKDSLNGVDGECTK